METCRRNSRFARCFTWPLLSLRARNKNRESIMAFKRRSFLAFTALALVLGPWARADDSKEPTKTTAGKGGKAEKPPRRVYVLHSGLHTILSDPVKNIAALTLKEGLHKRGVALSDLVVLENPFPDASWRSMLPYDSLTMFFDSVEPGSKMSQDSYLRMHKALAAQGVRQAHLIVWIGHAAG